jgi:single-stranded DNA-binding protein
VNFNAGTYRFLTSSDDGMRLYIDGQLVQDRWVYQEASPQTVDVPLSGGTHTLVVEFFQGGGQESVAVSWQQL